MEWSVYMACQAILVAACLVQLAVLLGPAPRVVGAGSAWRVAATVCALGQLLSSSGAVVVELLAIARSSCEQWARDRSFALALAREEGSPIFRMPLARRALVDSLLAAAYLTTTVGAGVRTGASPVWWLSCALAGLCCCTSVILLTAVHRKCTAARSVYVQV